MENKLTKVITGKVRFCYVNVWEPKSINGGDKKYSVSIIIPKSDKVTLDKIKIAIEEAKKEGANKIKDISCHLKMPLHDGDIDRPEDEAYKNCYYLNASSNVKPGIVNKSIQPIEWESEFYSGCYGRASIVFYAYNVEENKGIACGLHNSQKLEEGELLIGRNSAEEDFGLNEEEFLG